MYAGSVRPMVRYDRKIRYLDYMENGQRSQGAGFIKLERRDELCNISLQVSGIYRRDRLTRPFLLIGENGEKELCKLQLVDGGIKTYFEGLDSCNLGGQGIDYDHLYGVRIPISDGKEIRCMWKHLDMDVRQEDPVQDATAGQRSEQEWNGQEDAEHGSSLRNDSAGQQSGREWDEQEHVVYDSSIRNDSTRPQLEQEWDGQEDAEQDSLRRNDSAGQRSERERDGQKGSSRNSSDQRWVASQIPKPIMKEDKWEQLWMIYPHVHPFSDDREYLSVGPNDFVLLGSRSYKLVSNSFLLHGYYNFQHLILMRGGKRGQVRYYIGVPGNLYEREKKTAVMFGFEGFECAREPAEEGDFGYYLIPVEL